MIAIRAISKMRVVMVIETKNLLWVMGLIILAFKNVNFLLNKKAISKPSIVLSGSVTHTRFAGHS
jgi:hypothetical protein